MQRWVDAVAAEYVRALDWPLRSLSIDQLYAAFKAREARDACGLSYTLDVAGGAATTVSVAAASGAACDAPLTTGTATTLSAAVPAGGGVGTITLPAAVAWPQQLVV